MSQDSTGLYGNLRSVEVETNDQSEVKVRRALGPALMHSRYGVGKAKQQQATTTTTKYKKKKKTRNVPEKELQ
jgi:hypothetical protein